MSIFQCSQRFLFQTSVKLPGTGLGLAIVAQIAETHGGKVYVDSTPGDGTEFKITFPMLEKEAEVNKSTIQINAEELKAKLDEASKQAQNK